MPLSSRFKLAALALGALAVASPWLGAQQPAPAADRAVMLPPLVVQGVLGNPWRYAHPPGFEVLSRWSDSKTELFANGLLAAKRLFDTVLPPEFQVQFSVPTVYLLVPNGGTDPLPKPLMDQLLANRQQASVRFLTNMMLWDRDSLAVYVLQPSGPIDTARVVYSNDRMRLALDRRVPALPRWFVAGYIELYSGMEFSQGSAETGTARWISHEQAAALAADPESPRQLLPLADLFADPSAGSPPDTPVHARLRQAEASLFIRWALDGEGFPRRAALWKFVTEASAGPVPKSRFQALFGEDYVSVLNDLSDYLPWALTHSLRLTPIRPPEDMDIRMRDATPAEVGRIKGDWERLEMNRVAVQFPELLARYREHAQETFRIAHADDKTDPGLLAVMGLFDLDCGKPELADPLLRAAAAGHVVRPRVYYELARLLYNELIKAQPGSTQAHINPIQAAALLGLLDQARAQSPALAEVYGLTFQVTLAADARPSSALLNVFREGVRLFPENAPLMYDAAVMLARSGDLTAANEVLRKGLGVAVDPALRARLTSLQAALAPALRSQNAPPPVQ
jgi:hypothetical protein